MVKLIIYRSKNHQTCAEIDVKSLELQNIRGI